MKQLSFLCIIKDLPLWCRTHQCFVFMSVTAINIAIFNDESFIVASRPTASQIDWDLCHPTSSSIFFATCFLINVIVNLLSEQCSTREIPPGSDVCPNSKTFVSFLCESHLLKRVMRLLSSNQQSVLQSVSTLSAISCVWVCHYASWFF